MVHKHKVSGLCISEHSSADSPGGEQSTKDKEAAKGLECQACAGRASAGGASSTGCDGPSSHSDDVVVLCLTQLLFSQGGTNQPL